MKKFLNSNAANISAFSTVFFITSILLTLDIYCKNQVTPETPLYNIAGLPFLRMDFILILFTLTFLIGTILAVLLKKFTKSIASFALGALGCISIFMFLFDVNTMQLIAPTMRISHVIMTVSRVLAIFAGASGIFAGLSITAISNCKVSKKSIIISSVSAILLSVIANAENLQVILYLICGILLLAGSIIFDFSQVSDTIKLSFNKPKITKQSCAEFMTNLSLTVLFGILYSLLCNNTCINETGFTAISGLILLAITACIYISIINSAALFFGSIISYVLIHYASEITAYSGNRVIYVMPYSIGIVCFIIAAFSVIYNLICKQKSKSNE